MHMIEIFKVNLNMLGFSKFVVEAITLGRTFTDSNKTFYTRIIYHHK